MATYLGLCPGEGSLPLLLLAARRLATDLLLAAASGRGGRREGHHGRGIWHVVGVDPHRHVCVLAPVACDHGGQGLLWHRHEGTEVIRRRRETVSPLTVLRVMPEGKGQGGSQ